MQSLSGHVIWILHGDLWQLVLHIYLGVNLRCALPSFVNKVFTVLTSPHSSSKVTGTLFFVIILQLFDLNCC